MSIKPIHHHIHGASTAGSSKRSQPVTNPATGAVTAIAGALSAVSVHLTYAAARDVESPFRFAKYDTVF